MDSNLLKVFVTVANEKSISKAANSLGFAQSNVTSRVKQLEKSLDYKLFHRVPKGVVLTKEGEKLYPHAIEIVKKVEIATQEMGSLNSQMKLVIGSTESNAVTKVSSFLLKLHEEFPNMELELRTNTTKEIKQMLLDYKLDIAFISGVPKDEELIVLNKVDEKIVLVEPKNEKAPNTFLGFKKGCTYIELGLDYLFKSTKLEHKKLEFASFDTILGCVKAGMGKSIMPLSIVKKLNYEHSLKISSLPKDMETIPTCLIARKDYIPKIAKFLEKVSL